MRDGLRIVDSDAHVIEPNDIWTDFLDEALRPRAPRAVGLTFGFEFDRFSVNLPTQWSPDASPEDVDRMADRIQSTYAELFPMRTGRASPPMHRSRTWTSRGRRRVPLSIVRSVRPGEQRDRR